MEDINFASQALDDNMVMNGCFQSKGTYGATYGWTGTDATLTSSTRNGVTGDLYRDYKGNSVNADHLVVTVNRAGGSVRNAGYTPVPMAVEEGTDYIFSAFAHASKALEMKVEIASANRVYAETTVSLSGSNEWVKFRRTLTAEGSASSGLFLRLTFSDAATVYLDGVSFETTDSTVGIKNYLYDAVKDLSPKFVRFPGGCIIEGENFDQAYDWKNSIGAVANGSAAGADTVPAFSYTLNTEDGEERVTTYGEAVTRKSNINLWENNGTEYFSMEYGIGFYEYFCLCESLGASALPVLNCGKSCQGQSSGTPLEGRHGKGVADYIRDARDLIEFAKGDVSTPWGEVRANMGHPEPFEMNYLGIGNEQWGDYFTAYYEKFLEDEDFMQACEQYGVKLIVGNHQELRNCEGYDPSIANNPYGQGTTATGGDARNAAIAYRTAGKIASLSEYGVQDHHYYNSPVDFFLHAHLYDSYTREGADRYEVFVGEYSANNNFRYSGDFNNLYTENNWYSALAEAAAMTGFERNGDIVKLAAYAPMFAPIQRGYRHWPVDMMLFSNTEVVLTPNYFVQQMFMKNTATRKMNAELRYAEGFGDTVTVTGTPSSGGTPTATFERLFYVVGLDEATGDVIIKIVNAGEENVRVNLLVEGGTGIGRYSFASEEPSATSSTTFFACEPVAYDFGYDDTVGVNLQPYSLNIVRIHTR